MKPLELNVYPAGGCFTSADCELKQWCVECVEDVDKRFTDAELAAEYFAQQMEAVAACDRAYPWGVSDELDTANERIRTLERFATLPNYDEADQ